jgi:hypothetical protein
MNESDNSAIAENSEVFLPQIIKSGFDMFKSLDAKIRLEQINKITYIDTISRQLDQDVSSVNLFELFPNKDRLFTCNESEINKILVNFTPETKTVVRELQKLSLTQKENIKKASNFWNKDFRTRTVHTMDRCNMDIRDLTSRVNALVVERNKQHHILEQLSDNDGSLLTKQIEEILETKKYKLARIDDSKIVFELLDDVINTFKNTRAGIDLRVNLGTFTITVKWDGMYSELSGLSNNTCVGSFVHPHYDRHPCLGNLQEIMQEAQKDKNLVKIMEINETLLLNYNDGNPYKPLAAFAAQSKQVQPNGEVLKIEEAERCSEYGPGDYYNFECGECGYENEIQFDGDGYYEGSCGECDDYFDLAASDL